MELDKASELARELMNLHGLNGWALEFDFSLKRFGQCVYLRHTISLSRALVELNSEEEVRDTILHEIAHALTPSEGHSAKWREVAKSIGCTGQRCYQANQVIMPQGKYKTICSNCGKENIRHRKPKRPIACGDCCRKFNDGIFTRKFELKIIRVETKPCENS